MSNKIFPKELSKKIINEFVGDCKELLPKPPKYPFKKLCDETIKSILNNPLPIRITHDGFRSCIKRIENMDIILGVIRKIKDIGNYTCSQGCVFELFFPDEYILNFPIICEFILKLKLITLEKTNINIKFSNNSGTLEILNNYY